MKAIVIAVGNELTSGQTVDTNSAYISRELGALGVETIGHLTVGDDVAAVAEAFKSAADLADAVVVSGGLGPTADDITRDSLAEALGAKLRLDERCLARIEAFFRERKRTMIPANRTQAMIPEGAEPIENSFGTAPGLKARLGRASVYVLPGVPHEMREMFARSVAAELAGKDSSIAYRVVHTFGAGESDVGAAIEVLMRTDGPVSVGTTVAAGLVSVRVISRAPSRTLAEDQADQTVAEIRRRLGEMVIGEGRVTLASVVGDLLRLRKQTLATTESCTGGLISQMLTAEPGSSDYFLGGVVSYSNEAKEDLLGVPHALLVENGAVCQPVARAMAEGCRERFSSDWAISVTGIAGPGGGTEEKPVGLVYIGLSGPDGTKINPHIWPGKREIVRLRTANAALNMLRMKLM